MASVPPGIIDLHAHVFPGAYYDVLTRFGALTRANGTVFQTPADDLDVRLHRMDTAGVGLQILSPAHAPYFESEAESVEAAQRANDGFAAYGGASKGRFRFWASLPLPHVEASVREIRRACDDLGALGVTLMCFCRGQSIAQEAFEPIYAEVNRRKGVIFLHPCQNGLCSPLLNDWGLTTCAGASMEDSVAAMHLIARGIPQRYPDIRFIIPHLGGILPVLLERLDGQMPRDGLSEPPSATARRFFYDTVGWGSRAALMSAVEAFGVSQIVPGSDYPFLLGWEDYNVTFDHVSKAGLSDADVRTILHHNAQNLLGLAGAKDNGDS